MDRRGSVLALRKYIPRRIFRKKRVDRYLRRRFHHVFGYKLPAEPVRFSEKLFARMIELNSGDAETETVLSDKLAVQEFVKDRIGHAYLTPILWAGKSPEEIPFDELPRSYVIKTNHGSGSVVVVRGAPDRERIVDQFRHWLGINYYWHAGEAQYYQIEPRIYVEEFVETGSGEPPLDYRFFCFHGGPAVIQVDNHDHSINPFYDPAWSKLDLYYRDGAARPDIVKPANLPEMLDLARRLAAGFPFVRVDLYSDGANARFGEMTFTPMAGNIMLKPAGWDERLGALL